MFLWNNMQPSCPELQSDAFKISSIFGPFPMSSVGKLSYLSVVSWPDLSFVVQFLGQVLKNLFTEH